MHRVWRRQLVYNGERDKFLLFFLFFFHPLPDLNKKNPTSMPLHYPRQPLLPTFLSAAWKLEMTLKFHCMQIAQYQFFSPAILLQIIFVIKIALVQVIDVSGSNTGQVYPSTLSFMLSMTLSKFEHLDIESIASPRPLVKLEAYYMDHEGSVDYPRRKIKTVPRPWHPSSPFPCAYTSISVHSSGILLEHMPISVRIRIGHFTA